MVGGSGLQMVALRRWGMQLQIARRHVMVGSRWPEVEMPKGK